MGWLRAALAWAGVLYDVIRCIVCLAEAVVRRGAPLPKGWVKQPDGRLICPKCGP